MVLRVNTRILTRKVEGSKLAANSFFWTDEHLTREKEEDEFGDEKQKRGTGVLVNDHLTRERTQKIKNEFSLDPKLLSVNEKGIDSKDVKSERPLTREKASQEYEASNKTSWRPILH